MAFWFWSVHLFMLAVNTVWFSLWEEPVPFGTLSPMEKPCRTFKVNSDISQSVCNDRGKTFERNTKLSFVYLILGSLTPCWRVSTNVSQGHNAMKFSIEAILAMLASVYHCLCVCMCVYVSKVFILTLIKSSEWPFPPLCHAPCNLGGSN